VLLVGADLRWSRAVRRVVHESTGGAVDPVPCGRAALARLLDRKHIYSHVLLNPARADGLLTTILGLTCDEANSGTALLVLGRTAWAPSHACIIPGASHEAIRAALTGNCGAGAVTALSMGMLRTALADQRVDARYQPLVRLTDREPAGFEALARLYHVGHGMIAPRHFVQRMEDAGLAGTLTKLVTLRSLADLAAPILSGDRCTVSVNFPLDVLLVPDALHWLDVEREMTGVAASQVVIELTESRVVANLRQLRRVVEGLRRTGYHVAIDDVSPAVPRYAALLDMPFTAVKIDKDIVMRAAAATEAADFVERIIEAAKPRGLTVVAEGVQDARTWHRMRRAGVDLAQGYIIARPMPAAALPPWIEAWRSRTDLG
jgi:EAL domain-containing protein (putative c-di-GMP-specific phosphodiesterase class I)